MDNSMMNHSMSCEYPEGCSCGASEHNRLQRDITELNARLLERQESFNVADRRRVARIQELEDQLRLEKVKVELWKKQHNTDQEIIDQLQAP